VLLWSRNLKFLGAKLPKLFGSSRRKKGVGFFLAKASNFSRRRENLAFVPEFQYATMLQMLDKAQVKNGSMQD
jgi:hypothetical protein